MHIVDTTHIFRLLWLQHRAVVGLGVRESEYIKTWRFSRGDINRVSSATHPLTVVVQVEVALGIMVDGVELIQIMHVRPETRVAPCRDGTVGE
jgi:hypothetical protein